MKKLINKISKNKIVYIFLIFIIIMFPNAFYTKSEYQQRAILISVALDKNEEGYSINGMLVVPSSAGNISSNVELVDGKGGSVADALHSIETDLGKKVSLAHCDTIFVNSEILQEDLSKVLDYFIRGVHGTKNSIIIAVDGQAKDLLNYIKSSNKVNNFLASDLVNSENNLIGLTNVSLKEFYKDYFTPGEISVMSLLKMEDEQSTGQSSGGSSEGGSSSGASGGSSGESGGGGESQSGGSSGGQSKKTLRSENELLILKQGKQVAKLTNESSDFYNLINDQAKIDFLFLNDLNIEDDNGAITKSLGINIVEKTINKKYNIKNGIPILNYDIEIVVRLTEVIQEGNVTEESINAVKTHVNDPVKHAIIDYYKKGLKQIMSLSQNNKVDIFRFKEKLNKFHNKKWKEYYENLQDKNDYLNNFEVNFNLVIKPKF